MKRLGRPLALLLLPLVAPALPAQIIVGPVGPAPVVVVPGPGLSINYSKVRKNAAFSFSYRSGGYALYGPYGPGYGLVGPGYSSTRFTQIIVQPPPVIVPAPGILIPADAPPVLGPLAVVPGRGILEGRELPEVPPMADVEPPLPGKDAGIFRPLDPDNREKARRPVPPPPPKEEQPPDRPKPPAPVPDRPLPRPRPNPDPRLESEQQIELGREAFARGEYGRAAERFRQAADGAPNAPQPSFLIAQAHIALGNYRRAFDALQVGLRLDPDWPAQPFRPIEMYGELVTDHADHTQALEDLLAAMPDDPVMVFLTAYQLWFDGRRDEAKLLFQKAAPVLPDPNVVDRFLQRLPGGDVL